ncbi:unnamed protein product [Rhizophagus irregularis]|nr:unnamed protein product [Rhizophagus irregularis]
MALLGCFTAVATIPQDHLNENLKRNLLKTSITLGSFHLIQEIRQFIYSPKKWFLNYWNFFDLEHLNRLNASFIQAPDENTNMFTDYGTALFAIYLFLTGDPTIEKDNNRISYLMQKAEILAEIELFYLLPCQRRWKAWFPEVIHYYADVVKTREKVKEMISKGEWNINDFPELKKDLLDKLNIQYNPANSEIIRRDA